MTTAQAKARDARRTASRDRTKFALTIDGTIKGVFGKGRLMLGVVHALADAGVAPELIQDLAEVGRL